MQKIITFLRTRRILVSVVLIVLVVFFFIVQGKRNGTPDWVTGTVGTGTVVQSISVSGTIDATQSAELSFPLSGTLESLRVREGDVVKRGDELAVLSHDALRAQYQNALGALAIARADQAELITGLRPEERSIAETKVAIAREDLARTIREQDDLVKTAHRALLSTNLAAKPINQENDDEPPTITGTYTCGREGMYVLSLFNSSARSGYSYRLSGLEGGTYTAYTETPGAMGTCGLFVQFTDGESYGNSEWVVAIPNTESSSHVTYKNAYDLAVTTRDNAIASAKQALTLAEETAALSVADPRTEAVAREGARVLQAEALLAQISAQIEDHILRAPFDGTVTTIKPVVGEIVRTGAVMTMVSDSFFELTALIPEIDITRIQVGQKADIVFDARQGEVLTATITYISPLAEEIAGVSYFETTLTLDTPASWLRGGLNADIDILVEKHENVLRMPKRFLVENDGTYSVLVPDGKNTRPVPVTVIFTGNDGYAHIEGLKDGDTVVAP